MKNESEGGSEGEELDDVLDEHSAVGGDLELGEDSVELG